MRELSCQVTVVGGGPVGMGLAIELGQRGVSVVVVEKEPTLHRIPKGQNLTQRTMEHFRTWGVEDQVREARIMPPGYPAAGVNAYDNLLSGYANPWFRRSQVGQYYWAKNERLPQYLTEEALRARVAELESVDVVYGEPAVDVVARESNAVVTTPQTSIRSDFVVGCDGSHSLTRGAIGIEEEISDHQRRMVLLVFKSKRLHEILEDRFGPAAFFNVLHPDLDGYWRFLGRVDVGEEWFFHAPVPNDSEAETFDYQELIREAVGAEVGVDADYVGFWDLRVAIAETYRTGRGFIAGDAAHSHPPYGGYGINTGLEDARNLGWKLAAAFDGWGTERLLDSYTAERRPVFASTTREFIEGFIERDRAFIEAHSPERDGEEFAQAWAARGKSSAGVSDYVPHYEGSPIVGGPGSPGALGQHRFEARRGHHLPPPAHSSGEIFEHLGRWFSLVTAPSNRRIGSFEQAARDLRVPLQVIVQDDMSSYGTETVLVRPDHFVGWVDDGDPYEAKAVIARSAGI